MKVAKQPNGLYCIWYTIDSCPYAWNLTEEQCIEYIKNHGYLWVEPKIENYLYPLIELIEEFFPNSMTIGYFIDILTEIQAMKDNDIFKDFIDFLIKHPYVHEKIRLNSDTTSYTMEYLIYKITHYDPIDMKTFEDWEFDKNCKKVFSYIGMCVKECEE